MVDNQKTPKLRLVSRTQQSPVDGPPSCTLSFSSETDCFGLPAMPAALLQLELCLSATPVDLQGVTNIIKGDVGLTVQLFHLVTSKTEGASGDIQAISDMVVEAGVDKLRALAIQTRRLPDHHAGAEGTSTVERFWTHSRLTALLAEELASQSRKSPPTRLIWQGCFAIWATYHQYSGGRMRVPAQPIRVISAINWRRPGHFPRDWQMLSAGMARLVERANRALSLT
jgi:hypothetical protein